MVVLVRAWNTLVFSRSRNRSKSQEWMPKVLTDEPNGRIWLSANHANIELKLENEIACKRRLWRRHYEGHLGKTPQKLLAGAEPASHGSSFHFLPAGTALQCTASVHLPEGEQRMIPLLCCNKMVHYCLLNELKYKSHYTLGAPRGCKANSTQVYLFETHKFTGYRMLTERN